ncbi:MAG: winged helix-turn-helix transcriptional regulator [Chloroflexi bacterium]|nr:winged helix-turn-helix transcriptional regulator [Chloroflexota bacterium]
MPRDLITHNRIARLAADLTPAAFACLATFDSDSEEITITSVSGTSTQLFSQVNNSARRSHSGWHPTITTGSNVNPMIQTLFHGKKSITAPVKDVMSGAISPTLMNSSFARFSECWCIGIPIIIDDSTYAALFFASPDRLTKSQEEVCKAFTEQCTKSMSNLLKERSLTEQIEKLTEQRRLVQINDPLCLTQRRDATTRTPRSFGDIRLSLDTQTGMRGERKLNLTRREFDLLDTFLQSPRTALSRIQIISRVWIERNGISSNVLSVTIKNLREKLEAEGEPRVIHSLRAYGYVLKA